jgi:hypothetical protein
MPTLDFAAGLGGLKDQMTGTGAAILGSRFGRNPTVQDTGFQPSPSDPGGVSTVSYDNPMRDQLARTSVEAGHPNPANIQDTGLQDLPDVDVGNIDPSYSFAGGNEYSTDIYAQNPGLFARNLAEDKFGSASMSSYLEPRVTAAAQMANMGLIGDQSMGSGIPGLSSGVSSGINENMAVEDFMSQFAAPGVQFVDPGDIYQQSFQKAMETDFSKAIDPQTKQPMDEYAQIEATHKALSTAMAFASPEAEEALMGVLQNAAQEYMMYLAEGGEPISYPKFLETRGLGDLF